MDDVRMEILDLGDEDDDVKCIQQTYASQAERANDVMETEAVASVEVTNLCLLIDEEGVAAQSSAGAHSPHDEVIHL
jgi:predicted transcriptional regulator